jgi:hypothetical protein
MTCGKACLCKWPLFIWSVPPGYSLFLDLLCVLFEGDSVAIFSPAISSSRQYVVGVQLFCIENAFHSMTPQSFMRRIVVIFLLTTIMWIIHESYDRHRMTVHVVYRFTDSDTMSLIWLTYDCHMCTPAYDSHFRAPYTSPWWKTAKWLLGMTSATIATDVGCRQGMGMTFVDLGFYQD